MTRVMCYISYCWRIASLHTMPKVPSRSELRVHLSKIMQSKTLVELQDFCVIYMVKTNFSKSPCETDSVESPSPVFPKHDSVEPNEKKAIATVVEGNLQERNILQSSPWGKGWKVLT